MQAALPGSYVPELHYILCPYPQRPLPLWFALRWLEGGIQKELQQAQVKAHQKPPTLIDSPAMLDGLRLQELGRKSGEWLHHRHLGLLPPQSATAIAARHTMSLQQRARKLFVGAYMAALQQNPKVGKLGEVVNPFLVWYELVQNYADPSALPTVASYIGESEVIDMIVEDGEEAAQATATAITLAIERTFVPGSSEAT